MGKTVIKKQAFFYPTQSADTTSLSPTDQANADIKKGEEADNAIINLTQGKYTKQNVETFVSGENNLNKYYMSKINQTGYGRTLNVPKELPAGVIPGPSYNGAVTIGEKCKGPHCAIPVNPTTSYMVKKNLTSARPPPSANHHFPSTYRLGNNTELPQGMNKYENKNSLNSGPFNIDVFEEPQGIQYIVNPKTNRKVQVDSFEGRQVLEDFYNY